MQMLLHPRLIRSLKPGFREVVLTCNIDADKSPQLAERNFQLVQDRIKQNLIAVMLSIHATTIQTEQDSQEAPVYSEDIEDITRTSDQVAEGNNIHVSQTANDVHDMVRFGQCAEELTNWPNGSALAAGPNNRHESVLSFWKRQHRDGLFPILSQAVRVVFLVPSSNGQIELDFGIAGMTVTPERSGIAPHNVDMCAFLNCNRTFVDPAQCERIHPDHVKKHIPSNVTIDLETNRTPCVEDFITVCLAQMQV